MYRKRTSGAGSAEREHRKGGNHTRNSKNRTGDGKDHPKSNRRKSPVPSQSSGSGLGSAPATILRGTNGGGTGRAASPNASQKRFQVKLSDRSVNAHASAHGSSSTPMLYEPPPHSQSDSHSHHNQHSKPTGTASAHPNDKRMQLVSPSFHFNSDLIQKRLPDTREYMVIGCVGLEGSGKSLLMTLLSDSGLVNSPLETLSTFQSNAYFPTQSLDRIIHNQHQTEGIDMCLTSSNAVVLDCQPSLSSSVLCELIDRDGNTRHGPLRSESQVELQSLQHIIFLLSVCDVVVVANTGIRARIEMYQLMLTADKLKAYLPLSLRTSNHWNLKPSGPVVGSAPTSKVPPHRVRQAKAVFVSNQVQDPLNVHPTLIEDEKQLLWNCFRTSSLIDHRVEDPQSIPHCFVPYKEESDRLSQQDFEVAIQTFRKTVFHYGLRAKKERQKEKISNSFSQPHTTLREWLRYASMVHESIRRSSFLSEYEAIAQNNK